MATVRNDCRVLRTYGLQCAKVGVGSNRGTLSSSEIVTVIQGSEAYHLKCYMC
jgi:hypothetical protein